MGSLSSVAGLRCLVAGGRGFVGSALVRRLSEEGAQVQAPPSDVLDVTSAASVRDCLRQSSPDLVFNLAAKGVQAAVSSQELRSVNVDGAVNLVTAAAELARPPRVVMTGSSFEYAPSDLPIPETAPAPGINEYGASKAEACVSVRQRAGRLACVWVRPFNVYGPGEKQPRILPYLVACATDGVPAEVTAGEQVRDFLHVDDLAEALIRTALSLGQRPSWEVLNLGSGRPLHLKEFIGHAADSLLRRGLPLEVRFGAKPYRPQDAMRCVPELSKMRRQLGWTPATELQAGIDSAVRTIIAQ